MATRWDLVADSLMAFTSDRPLPEINPNIEYTPSIAIFFSKMIDGKYRWCKGSEASHYAPAWGDGPYLIPEEARPWAASIEEKSSLVPKELFHLVDDVYRSMYGRSFND